MTTAVLVAEAQSHAPRLWMRESSSEREHRGVVQVEACSECAKSSLDRKDWEVDRCQQAEVVSRNAGKQVLALKRRLEALVEALGVVGSLWDLVAVL